MRLVELGEAMRMVKNSREDCPKTSIKGRAIWETAHNCALSCLTNCSTIDPESLRPKGEWKPRTDVVGFVNCSVCHECNIYDDWADGKKWNFCPNCGAAMRGNNNEC